MQEVLVNRLGGLSLARKSVVRLTDRPDLILDVYLGRKTTNKQQQLNNSENCLFVCFSSSFPVVFIGGFGNLHADQIFELL